MATDSEYDSGKAKVALDHAWAYFSLHATQRLQTVNFFLIATAFLLAAFVTAIKEELHLLAACVALLSVLISYFFLQLEHRIRSLIKAAEDAMKPLQDELAESLEIDTLRIVSHVEESKNGEWKYSKVFRFLYRTAIAAFSLGFFYAIYAAVS
ncbi:MAG: hypothetical protein NPIRA05_13760 [Nitrospirales bacterium]|nr:MAG: hypothetical protein NPIRA05_13760 [Nitrospirales bacterium]